jgi:hypothetical protein
MKALLLICALFGTIAFGYAIVFNFSHHFARPKAIFGGAICSAVFWAYFVREVGKRSGKKQEPDRRPRDWMGNLLPQKDTNPDENKDA